MKRLVLLLALVASPAAATQEYILPTLFDVVDVAPDDVLNIRAEPTARAEIIGTLAPDAERIEVVEHDQTGRWGRVNTRERSGWVAMRYLAYRVDVWEWGTLPDSLRCFGTEPFWAFRPGDGAIVFDEPDADERAYSLREVLDSGIFRDPRRAVVAGAAGDRVTATLDPGLCSDGMSDRLYGLSTMAVIETPEEARLLIGCCSIEP